MRVRYTILAVALLCLAPTASWADLTPYTQDFEGLVPADLDQPAQTSLASDGWLGFVNVFLPAGGYVYGYGPFPAPNGGFGGPAISAVVTGEGGPGQGLQQLNVFSDYNNADHGAGLLIETNVFQEQVIGAADFGDTWIFQFDFKRGNIDGDTTAMVFIKTLDPASGYALTNFFKADLTQAPSMWYTGLLSIFIDPSLEGQILQFGFVNTATNYDGSGMFYDNLKFIPAQDQCAVDDEGDDEYGDFPASVEDSGLKEEDSRTHMMRSFSEN